jgi:hypothetical protein
MQIIVQMGEGKGMEKSKASETALAATEPPDGRKSPSG